MPECEYEALDSFRFRRIVSKPIGIASRAFVRDAASKFRHGERRFTSTTPAIKSYGENIIGADEAHLFDGHSRHYASFWAKALDPRDILAAGRSRMKPLPPPDV